MMDSTERKSENAVVKLADNSIVNIDGVQARLILDHTSGGIKVIPLDAEPVKDDFRKPPENSLSEDDDFLTSTKHTVKHTGVYLGLTKIHVENVSGESSWLDTGRSGYSATESAVSNSQNEILLPALSIANPSEPEPLDKSQCPPEPHTIRRPRNDPEKDPNILSSTNAFAGMSSVSKTSNEAEEEKHTYNGKSCRDVSGDNLREEVEEGLQGDPSGQMVYTEDVLSGPLDRHSEGDPLEQDILEQLLNSVTRDLQYIGAATNEVPAPVGVDHNNLFLTSSRLSFLRSVPTVSAESYFPDFHFPKPTQYVSQTQEGCDTERQTDKVAEDGTCPEVDFPSWQFTAEEVEMITCPPRSIPHDPSVGGSTPNVRQSTCTKYSQYSQILQKASQNISPKTDQEQTKKRGRNLKLPSTLAKSRKLGLPRTLACGQQGLKRLQPKPAVQTIVLVNIPPEMRQLYPEAQSMATPPMLLLSAPQNRTEVFGKVEPIIHQVSAVDIVTEKSLGEGQSKEPNEINTPVRCSAGSTSREILQPNEESSSRVCIVCNATFLGVNSAKFMSHILSHPTLCGICEEIFETETELFQHLCEHKVRLVHDFHGGVEFRCEICQSQYLHASNIQRHLVCGHGMKPDSTTETNAGCDGTAEESSSSRSTTRDRPKRVMCHQCGKQLGSKSLSVHLKLHCHANNPDRNTSPVLCCQCNGLFLNLMTFKKHLQTTCKGQVDEDPNDHKLTVTCPLCRKVVSLSSVSTHQRLYCPAAQPTSETCPNCGAVLRHKHSLRNHLRWHCKHNPGADSPTKCVCGKTFRNFKAFQSHYQNHCPGKHHTGQGSAVMKQ